MHCHLRPVYALANQLLRLNRCIKHTTRLSTMTTDALKSNPLIGVCQMTATSDREANFLTCQSLIQTAKECGAQMVFLPEAFDFIGESRAQSIEYSETLDGPLIRRYKDLAQELCVWLSLGGFHQKGPPEDINRLSNVHVVIDNHGEIKKTYAKVHLFDVNIKDKVKLAESNHTIPGKEIVPPIQTDVGSVGLGICYDLRFPEMSLALRQQGADILTYPSAFTVPTGEAHWEILLRCRAIETQCYVVAAAQTGQHNKKRASYGHAMIVDPWGKVVAEIEEGTGVCVTEVDVALLHKTRTEMSLWNHRRPDLYGQIQTVSPGGIDSSQHYQIGQYSILSSCVFYRTAHSFACVNIKPVVPGHALVWTLRPVERLSDLIAAEISDLFLAVQRVSKVIEKHYGSSSVTVAIQDGPEAGQTVKHFHVHILPRRPGDFERNDQIYDELQKHDDDLDADRKNRKLRSEEEMAPEANQLRKYFL